MNDLMRKRLDAVHDVRCPICGAKASWVQTSEDGFQTLTCGHEEVIRIINDRSNLIRPGSDVQEKHAVKFDRIR